MAKVRINIGTEVSPNWIVIDAANADTVTTIPELSGDVTNSNNNVILKNIVTAGTYPKITFNAKGLITEGSSLTINDIPVLSPDKVAQDANNRFVTDTEKVTWNAKASTAVATTSANGLMSAADKTKLNGLGGSSGAGGSGTGAYSHIEGDRTTAAGNSAHAEGLLTEATGNYSHAEGRKSKSLGQSSHAEGDTTTAAGWANHAEGYMTTTGELEIGSHAEGSSTTSTGQGSHAEGTSTTASSIGSHAEGTGTVASGMYSHAEGQSCQATATSSHAEGISTINNHIGSHIMGRNSSTTDNYSWHLGSGTGTSGLAAKITGAGQGYATAWNTGGADYAELFEWVDGNQTNEDRVGRFVTLDGEKIRYAAADDKFILGVVSAVPGVIGDSAGLKWSNRYLQDEWGRTMYHQVPRDAIIESVFVGLDENEQPVFEDKTVQPAGWDWEPIDNPEWDVTQHYVERIVRPEWDAVGLVGKLRVRDDGTCQVNGFCSPSTDGVATSSEKGFRVMSRVSEDIILVLIGGNII